MVVLVVLVVVPLGGVVAGGGGSEGVGHGQGGVAGDGEGGRGGGSVVGDGVTGWGAGLGYGAFGAHRDGGGVGLAGRQLEGGIAGGRATGTVTPVLLVRWQVSVKVHGPAGPGPTTVLVTLRLAGS